MTTLAQFDLPRGQGLALEINYTQEILDSGPYQPQFKVLCNYLTPGDGYFVAFDGLGPLSAKEASLEPMLEACRSAVVLGPTATEAEGKEPIVVDGQVLALSLLPETAYAVESTSSSKPSVITLNQPVRFGSLLIAPLGRVYVEYNDDPITLRDVYTSQDHTFAMAGADVAGDAVVCLRREGLRINGRGELQRCILARELSVGPARFPIYSEIEFAEGRLKKGHLLEDTTFAEATCRGGTPVSFDPAEGGLTRCVLAAELVKDEVVAPVGSVVSWRGPGLLKDIEVPAGATLKVGQEEFPGAGTASFSESGFKGFQQAN